MKKNIYIKPIAIFENVEVEDLLTPSKDNIKTNPIAPDNNGTYGEDLNGQPSGSNPPEDAKKNYLFYDSEW